MGEPSPDRKAVGRHVWPRGKDTLFSIRVPQELSDKIAAQAKKRGVTRNRLIRQAIEWYLEDGIPEYLRPKPVTEIGQCPICDWKGTGKCPTHGRSVSSSTS